MSDKRNDRLPDSFGTGPQPDVEKLFDVLSLRQELARLTADNERLQGQILDQQGAMVKAGMELVQDVGRIEFRNVRAETAEKRVQQVEQQWTDAQDTYTAQAQALFDAERQRDELRATLREIGQMANDAGAMTAEEVFQDIVNLVSASVPDSEQGRKEV